MTGTVMVVEAPLDRTEFERWRREASGALRHAELAEGAELHTWACFSAEQAAQLAVKGILHAVGAGPWGHDLQQLGRQLDDAGVDVPVDVADAMRRLTAHYIPARYADAHPSGTAGDHYGPQESGRALADARAILDFVDGALEPPPHQGDRPPAA